MAESVEIEKTHHIWMARCLELAAKGAGHVSPNPLVGSVLVGANGKVLGEGWHEAYGAAHAERNAIADAERRHPAANLQEATLYVNLEPCAHHGKTPPCTDIILEKGIQRVVVGMRDPNPKVAGKGITLLESAGIQIVSGVMEAGCRQLNEAYVHHLMTGRPHVTLKMAQTLDGCVATQSGDSKWISNAASRTRVHALRASLDAVLVGAGTALADDPALTVRHVEGRQPRRIVLDRKGALPATLQLFTDPHADKTMAITGPQTSPDYAKALQCAGGEIVEAPVKEGHLDLPFILDLLGKTGVQSILLEAGPRLASAMMEAGLVDRLLLFIAPKIMGEGQPTFGGWAAEKMEDARIFSRYSWEEIEGDLLFEGYFDQG